MPTDSRPSNDPPADPQAKPSAQPMGASAASGPSALLVAFGRGRRWTDIRVPSIAAVTVALSGAAQQWPKPVRLGGPITSLVLASLLDSPRGDLAAAGLTAWVETDRRDDRRDGWTTDRVGLDGRWVLFDQATEKVVSGSSGDGTPGPNHPVWQELSVGSRPADLDVQAWQRVDRTTWVLHDGDGDVFAELVIDEQRRMGTHEASVEARLVAPSSHPIFDALIEPLDACFGVASPAVPTVGRTVTEVQDAQWEHVGGRTVPGTETADQPSAKIGLESPDVSPKEESETPLGWTPVALEVDRAGSRVAQKAKDATTLDDLSWVIRAAVDVDTAARTGRPATTAYLRSLAGLVGVAPAMRALYAEASVFLDVMLPDLVAAEAALVRSADDAWALRRLHRVIGSGRDSAGAVSSRELGSDTNKESGLSPQASDWAGLLAPLVPGSQALAHQAANLRSMVLAMLEQSEPAGSAAWAVLTHGLANSLEAWITAQRNQRKLPDPRRSVTLRASVSAYRLASEAGPVPDSSHAQRTRTLVFALDRDLRWVRRRVALLSLVDAAAFLPAPLPVPLSGASPSASPVPLLGPADWMRVGVYVNDVRTAVPVRLASTTRRAKRLQREMNRAR